MTEPDNTMPRYIEPEWCVRARLAGREMTTWDAALMVFRDHPTSVTVLEKLGSPTPVDYRLIYNMSSADVPTYVHECELGGRRIVVITTCVWGGPRPRSSLRSWRIWGCASSSDLVRVAVSIQHSLAARWSRPQQRFPPTARARRRVGRSLWYRLAGLVLSTATGD